MAPRSKPDWPTHFRVIKLRDAPAILSEAAHVALLKELSNHFGKPQAANLLSPGAADIAGLDAAAVRAKLLDLLRLSNVKDRPDANTKRVICTFCAKLFHSNSSKLMVHIALQCDPEHPQRELFSAQAASSKTAARILGKAKLSELKQVVDAQQQPSADAARTSAMGSTAATKRARYALKQPNGIASHLDRKLSANEVKSVDEAIARWAMVEGLPLRSALSPHLFTALSLLNSTYVPRTGVTDWNLRNSLLTNEASRVAAKVDANLKHGRTRTLMSDGWSGVQRKHKINLLFFANGVAYYVRSIRTEADSVDGEYQCKIFYELYKEEKFDALSTDNARVMLKTWRLLRALIPGLFTYGCSTHGFNLHAGDILKIQEFKDTLLDVGKIVNYFNNHLQVNRSADA